ncbi:hypothetical protein OS965_32860 [Streptomyces sp. H27-G5]|uniref:hypothetical protein n=1 Tax=Streptomyces sp. H27-G5 TaxID=2996698 RepID=UPI0022712A58|nr:hypothetical protein [Streptomyces sp. H27-G5]MCY0922881.1 hypothetical protein [Streptomyces sp. H27-G5]
MSSNTPESTGQSSPRRSGRQPVRRATTERLTEAAARFRAAAHRVQSANSESARRE